LTSKVYYREPKSFEVSKTSKDNSKPLRFPKTSKVYYREPKSFEVSKTSKDNPKPSRSPRPQRIIQNL
jgi:hypothetical protein